MTPQYHKSLPAQLNQAVVEYLLAQDRGERLDPADLISRFPDVAEELKQFLQGEQRLLSRTKGANDTNAGEKASAGAVLLPSNSLAPEFTDLELISRGGMGIIYKAHQPEFDRTVALKFILLGRWASAADHERFRVEAQALGRLRHPAIAAVYSSGDFDGHPYLVMEFIDGRSLQQRIVEAPLPADSAAEICMQVSRAIAEAHRNQILHRDLKPSNILIDQNQQPRVTDFGLAKVLDDQRDVTVTGQIVGTPGYMSPEQAQENAAIKPVSDVYSLGAVLYASLTGRPPFRTESTAQTLLMVQTVEPPALRLLDPAIPRDLETICLKCLRKNPQARYATADELADDLQQFLDRQPIRARPVSRAERAWSWTQRHRATTMTILLGGLLIVFGAIGLIVHSSVVNRLNNNLSDRNRRLAQALQISDLLRQQERETSLRSQRLSYAADMRLAMEAWHKGDSRQVADLLKAHLPSASGTDVRDFAWRYLSRVMPRPIADWARIDAACYHVAFSPDGTRCLVSCADGIVRVFDYPSGKLVTELETQHGEVNSVTFRRDGSLLASAGDDGAAKLWTWPELHLVGTLNVFEGRPVFGVAFSENGGRLFTCGDSTAVKVYDLKQRSLHSTLDDVHQRRIEAMAISPDGKFLATAGRDGIVAVWDAESLTLQQKLVFHDDGVSMVAFACDSLHLVSGAMDGNLAVWHVPSGRRVNLAHRPDDIQSVAISDNGMIALTDRGGTVNLLQSNLKTRDNTSPLTSLATWQADSGRVYAVAFAPDQRQLITASMSGRITAWPTDLPQPALPLGKRNVATYTSTGAAVALSGSEILTCGPHTLTRRDMATGKSRELAITDRCFLSCDARTDSATGREVVVSVVPPNVVLVTPSDEPAQQWAIGDENDQIREVLLLPRSEQAVIRRTSGRVSKVDLGSGMVNADLGRCNAMTVADRNNVLWLAERGTGNGLIAIDLESGRQRRYADAHRNTIRALGVSPDQSQIVSTGNDRSVALWDAATGELVNRFESLPGNGTGIDWSPDGLTIAVCCDVRTVHLFQATTLREMGVLFTGRESIYSVRFTADGQWLIAVDAWLQAWALDGRMPENRDSL
ncbi:MAG: protein kinase [Planctomycetaceae bacterium]